MLSTIILNVMRSEAPATIIIAVQEKRSAVAFVGRQEELRGRLLLPAEVVPYGSRL